MKIVISVFLSLFLISFISGQKPDVEVYEKKDGEKTILIARNTGEAEATVKVTITSQGMDVTPSSVVESMIPGGFMKEMAVLVPRKGELWSYSYDVSIRRTVSKPADPASPPSPPKSSAVSTSGSIPQQLSAPAPKLSDAEIILYAKPDKQVVNLTPPGFSNYFFVYIPFRYQLSLMGFVQIFPLSPLP